MENSNEETKRLLEEAVENFKKNEFSELSDENIKKYETQKPFSRDLIEIAIEHARKDMMVRTLNGKGGDEFLKKIKETLGNIMEKYFNGNGYKKGEEKEFDNWHYIKCKFLLEDVIQKYYPDAKFGKAQKLVNMTFKYLYCFADEEQRTKFFGCCHMPIDSIILEWIKQDSLYLKKLKKRKNTNENEFKNFVAYKIPSWSNMDYSDPVNIDMNQNYDEDIKKKYTYNAFCKMIKDLLQNDNGISLLSPLEAEFIIWPRMQLYLTAKSLSQQLKDNVYILPLLNNTDLLQGKLMTINEILMKNM